MTLAQEARALETVSSKDASEISGATSAKVAVSGRARNARLNLEKAVEAADKALKGEGTLWIRSLLQRQLTSPYWN